MIWIGTATVSRAGRGILGGLVVFVFALAAVRRQQLETLCPELVSGDRGAQRRSGVRVPVREADDLLRAAETFVELVAVTLGVPRGERTVRRLAAVRESA